MAAWRVTLHLAPDVYAGKHRMDTNRQRCRPHPRISSPQLSNPGFTTIAMDILIALPVPAPVSDQGGFQQTLRPMYPPNNTTIPNSLIFPSSFVPCQDRFSSETCGFILLRLEKLIRSEKRLKFISYLRYASCQHGARIHRAIGDR